MSPRPLTVVARAAVVTAFAAMAHAPPAAAAPRTVPRGFVGVNLDGPMIEPGSAVVGPELQRVRRTGFGYVRAPMPWWYMQPRRPRSTGRRDVDGDVNFTETDAVVLAAARAGLAVLPVVGRGTPGWASGNPFSVTVPPRDQADFARFVGALVRRYGPRGWFWGQHPDVRPRPIRRWQIWNEPDLRPFWDVVPWAPAYVRLLRAAHRELRRADPGATVVAAALTNRSWEDLASVYDAGARGSFDAVAIHPYTASVGRVMTLVRRARAVMDARGDGRVPLLVTELGWPATTGHFPFGTDAQGQRRRIVRSLRRLMRARRSLRIASVCVYTWLSADTGERGTFEYAGLRRMTPRGPVGRPAERAVRRLLHRRVRRRAR